MAESLFAGARAKLERANQHIADLKLAVDRFIQTKPHSMRIGHDPQSGEMYVDLHLNRPIPPELALILGDAIHNMRTALDHATWEIIGRDGGTQDRYTQFITGRKGADYKASCNGLKTPRDDTKKFFAALEAHEGGRGDRLYALAQLDNADKHTVLTPVFGLVKIARMRLIGPEESVLATLEDSRFHMGKDGRTRALAVRGGGVSIELDQDSKTTIEVFFRDVESVPFEPVIPTLVMLGEKVSETLGEFDAFVTERPA